MASWRDRAVKVPNSAPSSGSWRDRAAPVPQDDSYDYEGGAKALGRGALQGATLGFGDEIEGAMGGGLQALVNSLPDSVRDELGLVKADSGDAYRYVRDEDRAANAKAEAEHGNLYTGGNIAGGLLVPIPGGVAKTAGKAALQGAGLGAAAGLGSSDADLTKGEYGRAAVDTLVGGVTGAAGGAGGHYLAEGAGKIAPYIANHLPTREDVAAPLRAFAERRAYKAAGPMLKDYRVLQRQGGLDRAQEIGRELLDSGAVSFGDNVENIAEKLTPIRQEAGRDVGRVIDDIDRVLPGPISRGKLADRIQTELLDPLLQTNFPGDAQRIRTLRQQVNALRANANQPLSMRGLEALKRSYDPLAKFDTATPNAVRDAIRDVRGVVQRHSEDAASLVDPDLAHQFQRAKERFSLLAPAEDMASDQALRRQANRMVSPSDYMAGMAGELKDASQQPGGLTGMAWAWAHKQLRERGNAAAAVAVDALANLIHDPDLAQQASRAIVRNPQLAQGLVEAARRGPQALARAISHRPAIPTDGPYSSAFAAGKRMGDEDGSVTHFVLSQTDPNYQEHLRKQREDGGGQ